MSRSRPNTTHERLRKKLIETNRAPHANSLPSPTTKNIKSFARNMREDIENIFKCSQAAHEIMQRALKAQNYTHLPPIERAIKSQLNQLLLCINDLKLKIHEAAHECKDYIDFARRTEREMYEDILKLKNLFFLVDPAMLLCTITGNLASFLASHTIFHEHTVIRGSTTELTAIFPKLSEEKNHSKLNSLAEKKDENNRKVYEYIKEINIAVHIHYDAFITSGKDIDLESFFSDIYNDCFKNPSFDYLPVQIQKFFRIENSYFLHTKSFFIDESSTDPSSARTKEAHTTLFKNPLLKIIEQEPLLPRNLRDVVENLTNPPTNKERKKDKTYQTSAKKSIEMIEEKFSRKKEKPLPKKDSSLALWCANGNLEKIKEEIAQLKNTHSRKKLPGDEFIFLTALFNACENGHDTIVKYLLEQIHFTWKINYRLRSTGGNSSLDIAVQKKHTCIIALLLEHPEINPRSALSYATDPDIKQQLEAKLPVITDYPTVSRPSTILAQTPALIIKADEASTDADLASFENECLIIETQLNHFREQLEQTKEKIANLRTALQHDINNLGKVGIHETHLAQIEARINKANTDLQNNKPKKHLPKNIREDLNIILTTLNKFNEEIAENLKKHPHPPTPMQITSVVSDTKIESKLTTSSSSVSMSATSFWHSQGYTRTSIEGITDTSIIERKTMAPVNRKLGIFLPKASTKERMEHDTHLLKKLTNYRPETSNLIEKAMQMDAILDVITTRMEDQQHYTDLTEFDEAKHVRNGLIHSHGLCAGMEELEFFDISESKQIAFDALYVKITGLGKKIADYFEQPEKLSLKAAVESDTFYAEIVAHGKKRAENFSEVDNRFLALQVKSKGVQYEAYIAKNNSPILLDMSEYFRNRVDIRGSIYGKSVAGLFPDTREIRHAPTVVLPPSTPVATTAAAIRR